MVSAPYVAEGRRKFALAAEKAAPYEWKDDEIELLREVAARIHVQLDRARAEQTLRESERRYRSLASVLTDIPSRRPRGAIRCAARGLVAIHGPNFERTVTSAGSTPCIRTIVNVRGCMGGVAAFAPALRGPRAHLACRTRQFRHIIARATPLLGAAGAPSEWVGACTDIHEETEQAQALIEADRRKDEFLAMLAHELRNPLAPIRSALEHPEADWQGRGRRSSGCYDLIERQVEHLARLVDDLLDVSRITRGKHRAAQERDRRADGRSERDRDQPAADRRTPGTSSTSSVPDGAD